MNVFMPSLIHLIYASTATEPFGNVQLTELLQQARATNEGLGLTGVLLHSDGNFFQVLEGERHSRFTVIIREPIARRSFPSWSMGFSSVSAEELATVAGLNDFFGKRSCFVQLDAGRAKKLLAAFEEGRWRVAATPALRQGA
jgi:hypothetical protein